MAEAREKARMDLDSYLGDARYEGEQTGLRKGRQEGIIQVAKNLLRKKLPYDDIADATGLSLDEIGRLAADLA